jgi:hypothetical protein
MHDIVHCDGPHHPRALEGIPVQPRRGDLDTICPTCQGRGQWNREIHGHGRSKREPCPTCHGDGWLETSGDATPIPDIVVVNGHAQWTVRYVHLDHGDLADRNLVRSVDQRSQS